VGTPPASQRAVHVAQVMSEWLNDRKLDRKALGVLAANWQAVEAYQEYVADEAARVLADMIAELEGVPAGEAQVRPAGRSDVPWTHLPWASPLLAMPFASRSCCMAAWENLPFVLL
jgi:hypothetical protein